jgi:hypothetical protein
VPTLHLPNIRVYVYNDQVKEDEMGKARSTNGEKSNAYRILVGENQRERDHYEYQHVGKWIILKWILHRVW